MNFQIWMLRIGKEMQSAVKKPTLICVKKPSCSAVKIIRPPPFSSRISASGACRNMKTWLERLLLKPPPGSGMMVMTNRTTKARNATDSLLRSSVR